MSEISSKPSCECVDRTCTSSPCPSRVYTCLGVTPYERTDFTKHSGTYAVLLDALMKAVDTEDLLNIFDLLVCLFFISCFFVVLLFCVDKHLQ